jgi:hypothetical protein
MGDDVASAVQKIVPEVDPKDEALSAIDKLAQWLHRQLRDLEVEDRSVSHQLSDLTVRREGLREKRTALQGTLDHLIAVWKDTAGADTDLPTWSKKDSDKK